MHPRLEEAKEVVRRAKADYYNRLKQAEGYLKVVVAQSPADCDEALAIQQSYGEIDFEKAQLVPLEQPKAKHNYPQPDAPGRFTEEAVANFEAEV